MCVCLKICALQCVFDLILWQEDESGDRDGSTTENSTEQKAAEVYTRDGILDYRGRRAVKAKTGGWRTSWFIYGMWFQSGAS
jgi:hypothetical protein